MTATLLRRSLAALATATTIACLAVASPAAAAAHDAGLTGGQITLTKSGITPVVFNLGATMSCTIPSTIQVDDGTGTTLAVTALNRSHVENYGTSNYLTVMTRSTSGNVAGTLNSTTTPHTITSMRVAVVLTIYNTTSCTPTGTAVCTVAVILNLNGTSTSTSPGSNYSLTGSSVGNVASFPTCTAGPSHIVGSAATVSPAATWSVGSEVTHTSTDTGGTLTFDGTGSDSVIPLVGTGTQCEATSEWGINHLLHTGRILAFTKKSHFHLGSAHYVAIITRTGSTSGQISRTTTAGVINSLTLAIQVDIYLASDQTATSTTCVTNGEERRARFTATFHLTGSYTLSTTGSSMQSSNTFSVASTTVSVTSVAPLVTPFTTYTGGTVVLTSWTGHVTS